MTLKEELEILRGEPIEVFDGDPMDIPCIETSDAEKLCKHPVVSVCMVTYNHESYIRQAIEGVLMQKTDFEYELVIGEDCSQDKTREICFEYQKKYPDKIRVLWWHENVLKLGGNGRRVRARSRGEFIAFCEGDDYWTDTNKLQVQVDILRKYKQASICFGDVAVCLQSRNQMLHPKRMMGLFQTGEINGKEYILCGVNAVTCTVMMRAKSWKLVESKYEILKWRLAMGDVQLWIASALEGSVCFIGSELAVYRIHKGGVSHGRGGETSRDGGIMWLYFSRKCDFVPFEKVVSSCYAATWNQIKTIAAIKDFRTRWRKLRNFNHSTVQHGRPRVSFWAGCFAVCGYWPFKLYELLMNLLNRIGAACCH